jgi:hypothetical protein
MASNTPVSTSHSSAVVCTRAPSAWTVCSIVIFNSASCLRTAAADSPGGPAPAVLWLLLMGSPPTGVPDWLVLRSACAAAWDGTWPGVGDSPMWARSFMAAVPARQRSRNGCTAGHVGLVSVEGLRPLWPCGMSLGAQQLIEARNGWSARLPASCSDAIVWVFRSCPCLTNECSVCWLLDVEEAAHRLHFRVTRQ